MDRFGQRSLDDVLATIAVPGADPEAVSQYVVGRLATHRRRSRVLVALAALLVLFAGGTAFALSGGEDPTEVVAPADRDGDATPDEVADGGDPATGSGTVLTAVPTTAPVVTVLPTSPPSKAGLNAGSSSGTTAGSGYPGVADGLGGGAPAPTPAAPSTAPVTEPPDRPLAAGAIVVRAKPVGEVVEVELDWSDPDLPAGAAVAARVVGTGDGALASAPLAPVGGACKGGTGASGKVRGALRFADPGLHRITVEIASCEGVVDSFSTDVSIAALDRDDPRIPLRVRVQGGIADSGKWEFIPTEGEDAGSATILRNQEPTSDRPNQYLADERGRVRPATVLLVPNRPGIIRQTIGGCTREVAVGALAAGDAVTMAGECP